MTSLENLLNIFQQIRMNLGILIPFGRSCFGIVVHPGRSNVGIFEILNNYGTSRRIVFWNFEILNNYGTSWKINILESPEHTDSHPCTRLPPLHPIALYMFTKVGSSDTSNVVFTQTLSINHLHLLKYLI